MGGGETQKATTTEGQQRSSRGKERVAVTLGGDDTAWHGRAVRHQLNGREGGDEARGKRREGGAAARVEHDD